MAIGRNHPSKVEEWTNMMLTFSNKRTHESEISSVVYSVLLDGEEIGCAIEDTVLAVLCDDFADPLQTFDSCRMLILEYTRQRLCGETTGICAHILLREGVVAWMPPKDLVNGQVE